MHARKRSGPVGKPDLADRSGGHHRDGGCRWRRRCGDHNVVQNGFRTPASPTPLSWPTDSHPSNMALVVVASDGTETSDSIESTTLVNLEPTATIQLLSNVVQRNHCLSGAASSTPTARTSATVDGNRKQHGRNPGFGADGEHGCHADRHGRTRCTHQTDLSLDITIGPDAKPAGHQRRRGNVALMVVDGEQAGFNVLRNGVLVGSTSNELRGPTTHQGHGLYTVQPFDEERTWSARAIPSARCSTIKAEEPGSATGLGLGLGALLILALLVLPLLGRRGGERR